MWWSFLIMMRFFYWLVTSVAHFAVFITILFTAAFIIGVSDMIYMVLSWRLWIRLNSLRYMNIDMIGASHTTGATVILLLISYNFGIFIANKQLLINVRKLYDFFSLCQYFFIDWWLAWHILWCLLLLLYDHYFLWLHLLLELMIWWFITWCLVIGDIWIRLNI